MQDFAPGLEKALLHVPAEGRHRLQADGDVPSWLRGSYWMNGPARFVRGDFQYRHWLDGDGMVCRLAFGDDGISLIHRFVRSHKLSDEEAAGRPLYRTFGTAFDGDRLVHRVAIASPVNVSIYPFAGRVLAFGEQGLPWELDPETLQTLGEHTFGRRLNAVSPFSAHPNFDPETGEMVNFGVSFAAAQPTLTLYNFTPGGELERRQRLPLAEPVSMHDFGLSPRYAVFYAAPYLLDVAALMRAGATIQDALSWQPERGSRLLVVDRASGEQVANLAIGARFCLHHVNCFEEGDRLIVDVLELEEPAYKDYQPMPDLFLDVAPAHPVRLVVDVPGQRLVERRETAYDLASDFPALDPALSGRRYRHFWMLSIGATGQPGRKFFDRLVRVDMAEGRIDGFFQSPARRLLGGEPVYVPRPGRAPGEPAGVVLCQQFDTTAADPQSASSFLLFDAADLERGPIARIPLPTPLHLGFHTYWQPA